MKLVALSVGAPREVEWRGEIVRTSIFKSPVAGPRHVSRFNIEGDEQSDLTVHGGADKAVYAYPAEHYPGWRKLLDDPSLAWGSFGENLTTEGLLEEDVHIGDRFRVGSAELVVTQPRMPCYKLGVRFGRADMTRLFHRSGRNGCYFSVAVEGVIEAGDAIALVSRDPLRLSVADFVRLYKGELRGDRLEVAAAHDGIPASWREWFRERLHDDASDVGGPRG
jgi:MOSC domain-containing protein YiiM